MEAVMRTPQPLLANLHRPAGDKRHSKKKPMLRSAWLWHDKPDKPPLISAPQLVPQIAPQIVIPQLAPQLAPQILPAVQSSRTEHKSETASRAASSENPYSIPLSVRLGNEDFTASITKSLEQVQKNTRLDVSKSAPAPAPAPAAPERYPNLNQVGLSMAPSSAVFSKFLGGSSTRDRASKSSQHQTQQRQHQHQHHDSVDKDADAERKLSFTDRRKLNAKELRLELSRSYDSAEYNMKRSGSVKRPSNVSSQDSSLKYSREQLDKLDKDDRQDPKSPSTPIHASVAQSISAYLGSLGLLTPPSSTRKLREDKAKEAHELKKQSIKHLTPPRTPSRPTDPSAPIAPAPASPNHSYSDLDWPKSPRNIYDHGPPTLGSPRSSEEIEDRGSLSEGGISPTNPNRPFISNPQPSSEVDSLSDGLFENPRQLLPPPPRIRGSFDRNGGSGPGLPLSDLARFAEPNFSNPSQVAYDIRDMVLPVVMIANAFGFPYKASVRPQAMPRPSLSASPMLDMKPKSDNSNRPTKSSLKVKTGLNVFPRRASSRASSTNRPERNSPYLQSGPASLTTASLTNQAYTEDAPLSIPSEASSFENLHPSSAATTFSATISAFDDDSSDDDYFGDLKHLSGLSTRNLRRRRTGSKRFSRDSANFNGDRPMSRLSLALKPEPPVLLKDTDVRHVSTENFVPVRQIPIPEEAQLSTSAGTFNKARFGSSRVIRDNEVHHLKDAEGVDHLVLEQEDGKNVVVSGTLDCLVMELCTSFETGDDEAFSDVFLRTSLLFTSPLPLLKGLTNHFRNGNSRVQERILLILERWLRTQPEDILEAEIIREVLLMFFAEVSCWGHTQSAVRLTQTYSQMKERLQNFQNTIEESRKLRDSLDSISASSPSSFPENLKLFFGDENIMLEVAQYLTAVDLILFRDASHTRTVALWWQSQTDEERDSWSWEKEIPYVDTTGVDPVIERVNRLLRRSANFKFWVQHELLAMARVEDRADLISSLIHLALSLREQGNFQSCLVIVDALATDTIISLENTWDLVPIERIREFSELRALLDQKTYINFFSRCKDFAIPYFPFFIKAVATILKQSTNSSSRYNDASKIHVDSQIESTLYRPPVSPSAEKSKLPPVLLDFKKFRSFVKEVSMFRSMTKYPPKFVWSLDRKCFVFRRMEIGRLAFPRDRDNASRATSRMRAGSVSSIPEDAPDASYLNHLSEIIEGRIDTVLTPMLEGAVDSDKTRVQQFTNAVIYLRRYVQGEDTL
ncbi:Ras protein-specific guanine nucleotide-releasing factor [Orbilia brochopaga]|uniref:Ras protein-specific guanine nucleotide-releasing factor n=1 Tax=Orbilia brochopaga TaxID=3140254 RepID=A0AAV9TVU0_9PEZI